MKVSNTTPFPYLLYQKVGKKDELFNVIALRQTFRLKTGGHYSDLNEQQYPLNTWQIVTIMHRKPVV